MDPDYSPPPPAYSEEEFDHKTVRATELSLLTPSPTVDEDGWERYDPRTFTDSSGRTHGSQAPKTAQYANVVANLPLPRVVPLRIEKKSHSDYNTTHSDSNISNSKPSQYHISTLGPEVDGRSTRSSSSSYQDGTLGESYDPYRQYPITPRQLPQPTRQSLPVVPRSQVQSDTFSPNRYSHPQEISQFPPPTSTASRIDFNPAVVYGKSTQPSSTVRKLPTPNIATQHTLNASHDPNAFYNSSVSAQLRPISHRPTQTIHPTHSQQSLLFTNHDFMNSRHSVTSDSSMLPVWQNSLAPSRPMHNHSGIPSSPRPTVNSDAMSVYSTSSSTTYDSDYGRQGGNWYPNS